MSQLALRALRGDQPLAFLAALGVARLAQEDCGRATRLGWPQGPRNGAAIEVDGVSTVDELAEILFGVVATMQRDDQLIPNIGDFPPRKDAAGFDPFKALGRSELRALAVGCRSDNSRARWIAGVLAVGGDPEHKSFKKSAGLLTTNKTTAVDRYLSHSRDSIDDSQALRFAMLSWRRRTGSNPAAYLDPSAVRDAGSTNADETPNYADPAAVWLALMALPLFPVVGRDNGSTSTTNWARRKRSSVLTWPTWSLMLPLAAIGPLLSHPSVARPSERCAALGISAVFESIRQPGTNAEGPLAAADQVWPKRSS
jgi:hypothetical protein